MSKVKISVVLPAYNEGKYLKRCLESLISQDYRGNYEIIIVDSNSKDQTAKIAKSFGIKVVSAPRISPAVARQTGFAASTGEIIATIDADNQAPTDWLSKISKEFEDKKTVCLFGAIDPLEGKFLDKILLFFYNLGNWASLKTLGFTALTGTNQAIRREIFTSIGGLEPVKLPATHADIFDQEFLFDRLRKLGKIRFSPKVRIKFSMRRFHQNGYLATILWGARQWLALHVWSGFGFSRLKPLKFSKIAAVGVIIVTFGMASALIANVSFNTAQAEFSPRTLREKISKQVAIIKVKTEPWLERLENFQVDFLR